MVAPLRLEPGTIFARDFRVVRPLSEGGMGAVYVVEQVSTGKERALKIMLPQLVSDPRARERFGQEARIGGQIKSDHLVEVVGAGIDEATQTPWLAMELLDGEDLAATMRRRGRLPPGDVREIVEQVGDALGQAHALGIVHRDLKPENLFVAVSRRRGVPFTMKILDFGIAKLVQENKTAATVTAAIGSPFWMAPEQAQRGDKVRPATDVWALGLIAFHLLTGRYYWLGANAPYDEFNLTALIVEVMSQPIEAASTRARALDCAAPLPAGFDGWFARCVDRSPTARFPDAQSAVAALAVALGDQRGAIPATRPVQVAPTIPWGPPPGSGDAVVARQASPGRLAGTGWRVPVVVGGGAALVLAGAIASLASGASSGPRTMTAPPVTRLRGPDASTSPVSTVAQPVPSPSPPIPPPRRAVPANGVRDSALVSLGNGVTETWRLAWTSPPTPYCSSYDEVTDPAAWCRKGLLFSDRGSAELRRERDGAVVDRFSLDPIYAGDDVYGPGRPAFPRWSLTSAEVGALLSAPPGTDFRARFEGRPLARILTLADFNGDGIAAEFVVQIGASPFGGGRAAALVGLRSDRRLGVFGGPLTGSSPVVLTSPDQWLAVRGGRDARLVQRGCGDHGRDEEEALVLRWEEGELIAVAQTVSCPAR